MKRIVVAQMVSLGGDMLQIALGLLLGFVIGAGCRWFDIPSPAPPRLTGAFLVVLMTLGFLVTDTLIGSGI